MPKKMKESTAKAADLLGINEAEVQDAKTTDKAAKFFGISDGKVKKEKASTNKVKKIFGAGDQAILSPDVETAAKKSSKISKLLQNAGKLLSPAKAGVSSVYNRVFKRGAGKSNER